MLSSAEFWVAVSFFLFLGLLVYLRVPNMAAKALDERAERIAREIAEAQKLREEAQARLAEFEKRRKDAESEAEDIIAQARQEADAYAIEARRKLDETVQRRRRMAENKIAQAEESAIKQVRATASEIAVAAAADIIAAKATGKTGDKLIEDSIKAIKAQLN